MATFREVGDLDGQNIGAATLRRLQIPRFARDDKGRVATFREVGDWMDRI